MHAPPGYRSLSSRYLPRLSLTVSVYHLYRCCGISFHRDWDNCPATRVCVPNLMYVTPNNGPQSRKTISFKTRRACSRVKTNFYWKVR